MQSISINMIFLHYLLASTPLGALVEFNNQLEYFRFRKKINFWGRGIFSILVQWLARSFNHTDTLRSFHFIVRIEKLFKFNCTIICKKYIEEFSIKNILSVLRYKFFFLMLNPLEYEL